MIQLSKNKHYRVTYHNKDQTSIMLLYKVADDSHIFQKKIQQVKRRSRYV